ncbi:Regulator_of chromosome condensation 1/beta-lactamase-inhibitor protein II [Hexamita inflata]|uniref:Regulator of chromosome condensation 1/beta-lactamase-inhibitor protein II n=1 Tax=Hexamita inflata TaxID=28002 RepID=A0AA86V1G3_9EUKA|nr:Regulator of chromosome condensation 1/beta-lactamase-inhibitor protein II [Hexamita inflata]
MIVVASLQQAFMQQYTFPYGAQLTQISNASNITDIIQCDKVVYQALQNGSVQAKGRKPALLGDNFDDFLEIDVTAPRQLYCFKDQLWYVSANGEVYQETLDANGRTAFELNTAKGMPASGVRQIVGEEALQFVLTSDKVLARGTAPVKSIYCGTPVNIASTFNAVPLVLNASEIRKLEISRNRDYLFVHMNSGDLFALGDNKNGILAPFDAVCERKVGSNISKADVGWNHTREQMCAYYLLNSSLFVYDSALEQPFVQLIDNVTDFVMFDFFMSGNYSRFNILSIQKNSFKTLSTQGTLYKSGLDYYCLKNASDPRCTLLQNGNDTNCYDDTTYILVKTESFCNIQNCWSPIWDPTTGKDQNNCTTDVCEGNITCKAVSCIKATKQEKIVPYCSQYQNSYVYEQEFKNAGDYEFINDILTQVRFTPPETKANNNMWIYVGAGCGGAVVLILVVVGGCICMKKKRGTNVSRNIKAVQPLKKTITTKTKRVMGEKQVLLLQ